MKKILAVILAVGLIGCQSKEEAANSVVSELTATTEFNGIVFLEHDDQVIVQKNVSNMNQQIPAPLQDSRVYLASLTKLFTKVTILKLVEAGLIDLDATLSTYRKDFEPAYGSKVTVRQLVDMTAGLPRELDADNILTGVTYDANGFAGAFLDNSADLELNTEPGKDKAYSNLGYWLLGGVIEAVTGKNVHDAYAEYIFTPLGMINSGILNADPMPIDGYFKEGDVWVKDETKFASRYTSGGAYSSMNDLVALSKALKDNDYLTAASKALVFRPSCDVYGSLPSATNMFIVDPKTKMTMIVLNNIGLTDLSVMTKLKGQSLEALGVNTPKKKKAKNVLTLTAMSKVDENDPMEKAMKHWVSVVETGTVEEIVSLHNKYTNGDDLPTSPVWLEVVRIRDENPTFKARGFMWKEKDGLPAGLRIYFEDTVEHHQISFLWSRPKDDSYALGDLVIDPDNVRFNGSDY